MLVAVFMILLNIFVLPGTVRLDEDFEVPNPVRFPFGGPFMGIFVALALPVGLKEEDIALSYNFEANYVLPENQTSFEYPPLIGERSLITRSSIFAFIQNKLSRMGYEGGGCLQRLICDSALHPMKFHSGVLGDILHIIFTPSSSIDPDLSREYKDAEEYGKLNGRCDKYLENCPESIIDFFTILS